MIYNLKNALEKLDSKFIYDICKIYNIETKPDITSCIKNIETYFTTNKENIISLLTNKDNIVFALLDKFNKENKVLNKTVLSTFFKYGSIIFNSKKLGDSLSFEYTFNLLISRLIIINIDQNYFLNPVLQDISLENRSLKHFLNYESTDVVYNNDFINNEFALFSTKKYINENLKNEDDIKSLKKSLSNIYLYLANKICLNTNYLPSNVYYLLLCLKVGVSKISDLNTLILINDLDLNIIDLLKKNNIILINENNVSTFLPLENKDTVDKSLILHSNMQIAYESSTTSFEAKMLTSLLCNFVSSDSVCYYEVNKNSCEKAFNFGYDLPFLISKLEEYSKYKISDSFINSINTYYQNLTRFISYDAICIEITSSLNTIFNQIKNKFNFKKINDSFYLISHDQYPLFIKECENFSISSLKPRPIVFKSKYQKENLEVDINYFNTCDIKVKNTVKSTFNNLEELFEENNLNKNLMKKTSLASCFDYQGKLTIIKNAIKNDINLIISFLNDNEEIKYEIIKPLSIDKNNDTLRARNSEKADDSFYPIRLIMYINNL